MVGIVESEDYVKALRLVRRFLDMNGLSQKIGPQAAKQEMLSLLVEAKEFMDRFPEIRSGY